MTPRFSKFIPFIIDWETVYNKKHQPICEQDPADPGGLTKFGIDHRSHPGVDIRNLTEVGAIQIYFDKYWTPNGCETMKSGLGEVHMNACVNTGPGRARKLLVISQDDPEKYIQAQKDFYARLAKARPIDKKFLDGWDNRLVALEHWLSL